MIKTTILDSPGDVAWDIALEINSLGYVDDVVRADDSEDSILFKGEEKMTLSMHEENGEVYGWTYFVESNGEFLFEGGDVVSDGFENVISFIKNWSDNVAS